ncbi:uncharacterized protein LOC111805379 isoform X3 [Cucurbita pepo subsp. pepo]|uniref:uncharacterized protein LOC111805379 isoform X3 n=1 Tax=Cucurbita pepo subsp. pepo TaxID=3664 RepID=UPI000C9D341E|nr:uncharacterized protein LOC111805379 isoform X3 [Cucurbita pepo subsp. pepo]
MSNLCLTKLFIDSKYEQRFSEYLTHFSVASKIGNTCAIKSCICIEIRVKSKQIWQYYIGVTKVTCKGVPDDDISSSWRHGRLVKVKSSIYRGEVQNLHVSLHYRQNTPCWSPHWRDQVNRKQIFMIPGIIIGETKLSKENNV